MRLQSFGKQNLERKSSAAPQWEITLSFDGINIKWNRNESRLCFPDEDPNVSLWMCQNL
jgi:hypothetical protein